MADLPTPISRQDELLHNIADGTPDISDLEPISREEEYLKYIALNGTGGGGGDIPLPVSIANGGTGATTSYSARTNLNVYSKEEVDTAIQNKFVEFTANIDTTWTEVEDIEIAPSELMPYYTKVVNIAGILETDNPIVTLVLDNVVNNNYAELQAWSCVSNIITNNGSISITCYNGKPQTAMNIKLICMR